MSAKPLPVPASGKVLVLRTCDSKRQGHNGFQWPASGPVACSDWNPTPACGNGLHGLLWGDGDWLLLGDDGNRTWLVVEVDHASIVDLGDKVKFPAGNVIFCGDAAGAIARVLAGRERFDLLAEQAKADGKTTEISSGDSSSAASSGYSSSAASSGDSSSAASSGDSSRAASSGNYSRAASSGNYSRAASSGNYSRAASSGYSSSAASSGDSSRAASSGDSTVAMVAGLHGWAKAGPNGAIALAYHDGKRPRIAVGHVGEGVQADTWYRADSAGKLIELDDAGNDVTPPAKAAKAKAKPRKRKARK